MEASPTILIIDDDLAIRQLLHRFLSRQSYQVESAATGETALSVLEAFHPNLVILDLNLPDLSGLKLLQKIQYYADPMVLILTNLTTREDKINSFAQGADDFLSKPFDLDELTLRIKALLRRSKQVYPRFQSSLMFGNLIIDPVRCEVLLDGNPIHVTALEFRLLHFMAQQPGRVWSRPELLKGVWGYECIDDGRVVDVHIGQLRRKLEADRSAPELIHTIRGIGYRFEVRSELNPSDARNNPLILGNPSENSNSDRTEAIWRLERLA